MDDVPPYILTLGLCSTQRDTTKEGRLWTMAGESQGRAALHHTLGHWGSGRSQERIHSEGPFKEDSDKNDMEAFR